LGWGGPKGAESAAEWTELEASVIFRKKSWPGGGKTAKNNREINKKNLEPGKDLQKGRFVIAAYKRRKTAARGGEKKRIPTVQRAGSPNSRSG